MDEYASFRLENMDIVVDIAKQAIKGSTSKEVRDLLTKINNHIDRHDYVWSVEEVLNSILENSLLASFFAKDPKKQNKSEFLVCKKFLAHNLDVIKLPNGGPNSLTIYNGAKHTGTRIEGVKSVDFVYKNVLISHKTISGKGGHQDNQFNDLLRFIEEARTYMKSNCDSKFAAICDGDYFTESKKQILKQQSSKIFIGSSDEFIETAVRSVFFN